MSDPLNFALISLLHLPSKISNPQIISKDTSHVLFIPDVYGSWVLHVTTLKDRPRIGDKGPMGE
jgi:hypothetical protein